MQNESSIANEYQEVISELKPAGTYGSTFNCSTLMEPVEQTYTA